MKITKRIAKEVHNEKVKSFDEGYYKGRIEALENKNQITNPRTLVLTNYNRDKIKVAINYDEKFNAYRINVRLRRTKK